MDPIPPEILSVVLEESTNIGEGIRDGVFQSGERMDVILEINDINLDYMGDYYIFGDFTGVEINPDGSLLEPTCRVLDGIHKCEFNDIELRNGYLKRNVTLYVYDAATNMVSQNITVEIFNVDGESPDPFRVVDNNKHNGGSSDFLLNVNPQNRNVIYDTSATVWFSGNLTHKVLEDLEDYKIINFQIIECTEEGVLDFAGSSGQPKFYPQRDGIVYVNNSKYEIDNILDFEGENFYIKSEIASIEDYAFINNLTSTCTMSVRLRDNFSSKY